METRWLCIAALLAAGPAEGSHSTAKVSASATEKNVSEGVVEVHAASSEVYTVLADAGRWLPCSRTSNA